MTVSSSSPKVAVVGGVRWGRNLVRNFAGLGALGLFAAIPAAVFYNYFGHVIKEIGARMEDFSLEFMNLAERSWE